MREIHAVLCIGKTVPGMTQKKARLIPELSDSSGRSGSNACNLGLREKQAKYPNPPSEHPLPSDGRGQGKGQNRSNWVLART